MIAEFGTYKNGYYYRIEHEKGKSVFYHTQKDITDTINSATEKIDLIGAESILVCAELIKLINKKNAEMEKKA